MNNSNNFKSLFKQVNVLKKERKYDEALKILEELYEKNPNSEEIRDNLIKLLFEFGGYLNDDYTLEYEKAKQCFEKIITLNPKNYRAYYNLGIAYYNLEQLDNAKKVFLGTLEIKPDYKYCLYNLGLVYEDMKEYELALEYYEKALEVDSKFSYALTARTQIRKKLDELKYLRNKK